LWRSQEQSILVGVQTVIDDDPKLTNRKVKGSSPLRIVIDLNDRIPKNSILLNDENPTLIFSSKKKVSNKEIVVSDPKNVLQKIMSVLFEKNIQSLIVEGGTKTIQKFIDQNLWDEARTFISTKKINDGVKSPLLNNIIENRIHLEKDELQISTPSRKKEF
jgi:diaminohydroxyphosphoribosylaminopyrimidine deaminase/5-amino-6-(5-phosphoribosylamino)uracil reductase